MTAKRQLFPIDQASWPIHDELFWTRSVTSDHSSPQTITKPKQLCPRLIYSTPGTTKLLRDTGLLLTESCHICTGGQNPWRQLEKQHYISSRKWAVFAWLSLNSPKCSDYLLIVFKKGQVSSSVSNRMPCTLCITTPTQSPSCVRDVHTPSLLFPQTGFPQTGCFLPGYKTRTMLNLIPLTVLSRQFLPAKGTLPSQTGLIPPSVNSWAAHLVSQTSSLMARCTLSLKATFSSVCFPTKGSPMETALRLSNRKTSYLVSFLYVTNFLQCRRVVGGEFFSTRRLMPFIVNKYLKREQRKRDGEEKRKESCRQCK